MTIQIKVDCRETELLKELMKIQENLQDKQSDNVSIEIVSANLPLGDVIISIKENNIKENNIKELLILERKTVQDLSASILDGRYEEQSFRLNGYPLHNHNIIYLIEGELVSTSNLLLPIPKKNTKNTNNKKNIDKNVLYSAMFSINYYKGFSLMRSFNIMESAAIIYNMAAKLMREEQQTHSRNGYYAVQFVQDMSLSSFTKDITSNIKNVEENVKEENVENVKEENVENVKDDNINYCSVVKKVKRDNITRDNIGVIMLSQIPGVSWQCAADIMDVYKTIGGLIEALYADKSVLNDFRIIHNKSEKNNNKSEKNNNKLEKDNNKLEKGRRISKTAVANIIEYLL